jgi:hypothetical protein
VAIPAIKPIAGTSAMKVRTAAVAGKKPAPGESASHVSATAGSPTPPLSARFRFLRLRLRRGRSF